MHHVMLRISDIMAAVFPFQNLPTLCYTMLSAALRSWKLLKLPKKLFDSDFIAFIIYIIFNTIFINTNNGLLLQKYIKN